MPHRRTVLGFDLTSWQARALYALPDTPTTASALLEAAQYSKTNGLYPRQRRELLDLAPSLVTVTPGPRGPLYARTALGAQVAEHVFPTPPRPPQRGGRW